MYFKLSMTTTNSTKLQVWRALMMDRDSNCWSFFFCEEDRDSSSAEDWAAAREQFGVILTESSDELIENDFA